MFDPPRITVAIPYYRGERHVRRAVESVLAQADGRWELVFCDGGQTPTPGVVEAYRDPRVRYLPPDGPPGMAANWNRGLAAATTELVTLLHQDDELRPGYVGGMLAAAERHPEAAVLFCEAAVIGEDGSPTFSFPDFVKRFVRPNRGREVSLHGERGLRAVMRANFVMCPTMCFRVRRLGPVRFDPRWRQVLDLDLIARLLLAGEMLVGVPDVLYAYRRHAGNATAAQTQTLLRFREERDLFREVAAAARKRGWPRAAATADHLGIVKLNLGFCFIQDMIRGRWQDAGRKARMLAELMG